MGNICIKFKVLYLFVWVEEYLNKKNRTHLPVKGTLSSMQSSHGLTQASCFLFITIHFYGSAHSCFVSPRLCHARAHVFSHAITLCA